MQPPQLNLPLRPSLSPIYLDSFARQQQLWTCGAAAAAVAATLASDEAEAAAAVHRQREICLPRARSNRPVAHVTARRTQKYHSEQL